SKRSLVSLKWLIEPAVDECPAVVHEVSANQPVGVRQAVGGALLRRHQEHSGSADAVGAQYDHPSTNSVTLAGEPVDIDGSAGKTVLAKSDLLDAGIGAQVDSRSYGLGPMA